MLDALEHRLRSFAGIDVRNPPEWSTEKIRHWLGLIRECTSWTLTGSGPTLSLYVGRFRVDARSTNVAGFTEMAA